MKSEEIATLAREYAEELSPDNKINREMIELDCLGFLDRVLNSYCLVEKSKVEKEYRAAKKCLDKVPTLSIIGGAINGQIIVLESLFPEIGKEVEE